MVQAHDASHVTERPTEKEDYWTMLPLDAQVLVVAMLCTQSFHYPHPNVLDNVRNLRSTSRACRIAVNTGVTRAVAPRSDSKSAHHQPSLLPGMYPAVTSLNLSHCSAQQTSHILDNCLRKVQRFARVVKLHVGLQNDTAAGPTDPDTVDHMLDGVKLQHLRDLDIRLGTPDIVETELSPFRYHSFANLGAITNLRLRTGAQQGIDFARLRDFPAVIHLSVAGCEEFTDISLSHLTALTRLQKLSLRRTSLAGADHPFPYLSTMTALTSLDLSYTIATNADIAGFTALKHLEVLSLEGNRLRDSLPRAQRQRPNAFVTLSHLTTLTSLNISRNRCRQGMHYLSCLTRLQDLHLGGRMIWMGPRHGSTALGCCSNEGLQALTTLKLLKILQVPNNRDVTNHGLQAITRLTTLQELDLSRTGCRDDGLPVLCALPHLRVLAVDHWRSTLTVGLLAVLEISALRCVSVFDSNVPDSLIEMIQTQDMRRIRTHSSYRVIELQEWSTFEGHLSVSGDAALHRLQRRVSRN